jgi:hypothetical protein
MAPTVGSSLPASFPAGTTVKYRKSFGDYQPGDSWAVTLYLAGPSVLEVAGTPVPSARAYDFTLPAAETLKLKAGAYQWAERASKSGEVYVADSSEISGRTITVTANVAGAGAGDLQSDLERRLELINAVLLQRLDTSGLVAAESYLIDGISITRVSRKQLREERASIIAALRRKKNGGRLGTPVRVVFGGTNTFNALSDLE